MAHLPYVLEHIKDNIKELCNKCWYWYKVPKVIFEPDDIETDCLWTRSKFERKEPNYEIALYGLNYDRAEVLSELIKLQKLNKCIIIGIESTKMMFCCHSSAFIQINGRYFHIQSFYGKYACNITEYSSPEIFFKLIADMYFEER